MTDIVYLAARELHFTGGGIPADAEGDAAQKAISDLLLRARGREFTRDENRVFRKYLREVDAAKSRMVEHARTKGLLPNTKEA